MNDTTAPDLATAIAQLEAVELQLIDIDADELNRDQRNRLAKELAACSLNLMKLRNAALAKNLAEPFKMKEQQLLRATAQLERALRDLEDTAEIIETVSVAMRTVTEIVKLLA